MNIRLGVAAALLPMLIAGQSIAPSATAAPSEDGATVPSASTRAAHRHYEERARRVAREIDCRNIFSLGALQGYYDAAKCDIRGERVDLITFASAAQQRRFIRNVDFGGRNYWWANGKGALVAPVGRSEKDAAKAAARRLPGDLKRG